MTPRTTHWAASPAGAAGAAAAVMIAYLAVVRPRMLRAGATAAEADGAYPGEGLIPDGSQWWEVAALDPERFLGLRMSLDLRGRPFDPAGERPHYFTDSLWGFELKDVAGGRTRLIVSGYWSFRPRWLQPVLSILLLEPSHWVMQTRQFRNLKRRAESDGA